MNPLIIETMLREKRQDMLQEARRQQLLAEYERNRPGLSQRLGLRLGEVLIRLGERLRKRCAREVALPLDPCCRKAG